MWNFFKNGHSKGEYDGPSVCTKIILARGIKI